MIGAVLFYTLAGPGLLTLGVWTLRSGAWRDGVPVAELLIDRVSGVEPLPRTDNDQRFARFVAWLNVGFGAFFTLCLAAVLFSLISE